MQVTWEQVIEAFEAQSLEALDRLEQAALVLERDPGDQESLELAFRLLHTLKGDSATVNLQTLSETTHRVEDLLSAIRGASPEVDLGVATAAMVSAVDVLRDLTVRGVAGEDDAETPEIAALLERIRRCLAGETATSGPSPADAQATATRTRKDERRTLRVPVATLDRMLDVTGELAIARSRLANALTAEGASPEVLEAHEAMDRLFAGLQEEVMRARMVSLGPLLRQQSRTLRDAALATDKLARLEVGGDGVDLDMSVLERLADALGHLVRNAVVHGIEAPAVRVASGKPEAGTISITARQSAAEIVVRVEDDGAGLDFERIRERHLASGVDPGETLSDTDIADLIFTSGFSTSDSATQSAGRGVGLDVVRNSLDEIGASVSVSSARGRGTAFTLRLPLTLAIIDGFAVGVGDEVFVLPLRAVSECIDWGLQTRGHDTGISNLRGRPLPWVRLGALLDVDATARRRNPVVVVKDGERSAGLLVDRLIGDCQSVVKPLGQPLRELPGLGGTTILGDGSVALLLDVRSLLRRLDSVSLAA